MNFIEPTTSNLYEEGLWEYILIAAPDETVNRKILEEKEYFDAAYEQQIARFTKAYIAIANFMAKERMEDIVLKWIQRICNLHTQFSVTLNNFSGVPPHTIYLRVQNVQPFLQLASHLKILDGFIRSYDCPPVNLNTSPHLIIAGKIPEYIYEKAIHDYSRRSFNESFELKTLTLLKREDQHSRYQIVNVFTLPKT